MNKVIYILVLIIGLFFYGCSKIDDDLSECIQMRVYVDYDDPDPVEWGNYNGIKTLDNKPKDVKLYIFDKYDNFIDVHYITTHKVYDLPYKELDSIQYIAIVSNDDFIKILPDFVKGERLKKDAKNDIPFITLEANDPYHDIQNISQSPDDFQMKYGFIPTIRKDNEMAPHYIYVERKVGAIRCIIIGLNEFLSKENSQIADKNSPYTILFGETPKDVCYNGNYTRNWTHINLPIIKEINDTITTEFVNTFPTSSEKESEIKIFKHNYQVLKKNGSKNNVIIYPGRPRTVIINFNENTSSNEGGMGVTSDKWDTVNVEANF